MSWVSEQARSASGNAFFGMPFSAVGRITAVLFLIIAVSIALMATVVEPSGPAWRGAFATFVVVCVAVAGVTGVVAILAKNERSWAVVIPTLLCSALIINEVLQRL